MSLDSSRNVSGRSLEASAGEPATRRPASVNATLGKHPSALPNDATKARGRARKIARIQKALADGSYEVSAPDLAEKLIDHMLGR